MCINHFMNSDDCISHFHRWNIRKTTIYIPYVRLNWHFRYLNTFNVYKNYFILIYCLFYWNTLLLPSEPQCSFAVTHLHLQRMQCCNPMLANNITASTQKNPWKSIHGAWKLQLPRNTRVVFQWELFFRLRWSALYEKVYEKEMHFLMFTEKSSFKLNLISIGKPASSQPDTSAMRENSGLQNIIDQRGILPGY